MPSDRAFLIKNPSDKKGSIYFDTLTLNRTDQLHNARAQSEK